MYIKIKHIKKILLISACIFFAGFNYLTYVKAEDSTAGQASCDKAIDPDCDGLTNAEEQLYGTNASNGDSDNDGYSDGVEVKSGYDPMKPAPGDRVTNSIAETDSQSSTSASESLTSNFANELQSFVASKNGQPISNSDLNDFVTRTMSDKLGQAVTIDSLPEIDSSQIKILKQPYANLSKEERATKKFTDAEKYFTKLQYILLSNAPGVILTSTDLEAFNENFKNQLISISNPNTNLEYFVDLGNRLELFTNQTNDVEVPETMFELHIKFLRITKGLSLTFQGFSYINDSDPIERMAICTKISAYTNLYSDFLTTDLQNYSSKLEE
ncbi:MAG: hypothetical protein US70_C0014G0011 [Parcubacteria group bacterium GW2011_GWD2_38_11]|nr:MAG: hypothetical protein US70_C0014G0011 [Parcubacteria group bacterium GW2011_GWD2_38_11]